MRRAAWFLFFFCVVIYNSNRRYLGTGDLNRRYLGTRDTIANVFLPISVILHGDLYLDRYPTLTDPAKGPPYFLQSSRGRLISVYPVLPALMAIPVYLGPALWLHFRGVPYESWTFHDTCLDSAKLAASMITAGSAVFVFLGLAVALDRAKAFAAACLYAFGTAAFPIASQGLWGHGPAMLFLALAAYLWLRHPERVVALGAALSLAVAARPSALVPAAIFAGFVALREPRKLARFLAGPAVVGAALAASNMYYYGVAHGGYAQIFAGVSGRQKLAGAWTTDIGQGLAGLLLSPSRGLLIFSPFLAAAFLGLWRTLRDPAWERWRPISLSVVGLVVLSSSYATWWGGLCYGPRYLADACPYLALLLAPVWPAIEAGRLRRLAFQAAAGVSLFIQFMGVMIWDGSWYTTPTNVDIDHARLWDWKDSEIARTVRSYSWSHDGKGR